MKEYTIVWQPFAKESEFGKFIKAQDNFELPYFIDGIEKIGFERKQEIKLNDYHLVKGILVGYNNIPPLVNIKEFKRLVPIILAEAKNSFNIETTEQLILNFSTQLREENGDTASLLALLTGIDILPNSSKIKTDCCIDIWNRLERKESKNLDWDFEKIKSFSSSINLSDISPLAISFVKTVKIISLLYFKEIVSKKKVLNDNQIEPYYKKLILKAMQTGNLDNISL